MPYQSLNELPKSIKGHLPKQAQEIYKAAFNNAWKQYDNPEKRQQGSGHEETAHRVAWAAVEGSYYKDELGIWRENDEN